MCPRVAPGKVEASPGKPGSFLPQMWPSCTVLRLLRTLVHVVCCGPLGSACPRGPGNISAMLRGVDLWGSFDYLQIHFPVHSVASRRLGDGPRAYSQPCRSTGARRGLKYAASLRRPHQALKEHQNSVGTELETPETHRSLPVASWGSYLRSGDRRICCEKGTVGKV